MDLTERYWAEGPQHLTDAELLALGLTPGRRGPIPVDVAEGLVARFGGLGGLLHAPLPALRRPGGLSTRRAVAVHALLEAGRRAVCDGTAADAERITSPEGAWRLLRGAFVGQAVEALHGVYLDRARRVLFQRELTRGSDSATVVDPRQVFQPAVQLGASAVLVAHNHPSGDPTPSRADRSATARLCQAGQVLGIPLIDHLVIGRSGYVSLAEDGLVPAVTLWS